MPQGHREKIINKAIHDLITIKMRRESHGDKEGALRAQIEIDKMKRLKSRIQLSNKFVIWREKL